MKRSDFPVTENLIYLNHAGVAPLVRPAAEAMQKLADDALRADDQQVGDHDRHRDREGVVSRSAEQLLEQILTLDPRDRAELADQIDATLEPSTDPDYVRLANALPTL